MTNKALGRPLQKLSAANKLYMTEMSSPCVYYNYETLVIQLRNDSLTAPCSTSGSKLRGFKNLRIQNYRTKFSPFFFY